MRQTNKAILALGAVGVGIGAYLLLRNRPTSFSPMISDGSIPQTADVLDNPTVVENRSLSYANQPTTNNYVTYQIPSPQSASTDPANSNPDPTATGGATTNDTVTQPSAIQPVQPLTVWEVPTEETEGVSYYSPNWTW